MERGLAGLKFVKQAAAHRKQTGIEHVDRPERGVQTRPLVRHVGQADVSICSQLALHCQIPLLRIGQMVTVEVSVQDVLSVLKAGIDKRWRLEVLRKALAQDKAGSRPPSVLSNT